VRYEIRFDAPVPADALQRILAEDFTIPPARVYVGALDDRPIDGEPPVAIAAPPEGQQRFGWVLTGDTDLATATGMTERDLACHLSRRLGLRSLIDDGTADPDRWLLATPEGGCGTVIVDEDAAVDGDLAITHAVEPITGAPELSVVPERRWPAAPTE
jgi:hypothetical protein